MGVFHGSPKLSSKAPAGKMVAAASCYASFRNKVLMCLTSACIVTFRGLFLIHLGTEQAMTVVENFGNQEIQILV